MLQFVYLSFATPPFEDNSDANIDDILKYARVYNQENNITGMLLYKGGVFLQMIEGEKEVFQNLFGRIAMDLRHENIKTLVKQNTTERLFKDWTMAYKKIDDIDSKLINTILPWEEIVLQTQRREKVDCGRLTGILQLKA